MAVYTATGTGGLFVGFAIAIGACVLGGKVGPGALMFAERGGRDSKEPSI